MKKFFLGVLICAVLFLSAAYTVLAAMGYNFGGKISYVFYSPYSPCVSSAILVLGPRPGLFLIPPAGSVYSNYQWNKIGTNVLGTASAAYCGTISKIGTSR